MIGVQWLSNFVLIGFIASYTPHSSSTEIGQLDEMSEISLLQKLLFS
jgi:hypothetical protein